MTDVLRKSLTDIVDLVASREISAVELMKETLRRIEETQDTLRAFCQVGDPALIGQVHESRPIGKSHLVGPLNRQL